MVVSWPSLVVGWPLHLLEEAGAAVAAVGFRCSDVAAVLRFVTFLEAVSEGPLECPQEARMLVALRVCRAAGLIAAEHA